MGGKKKLLLAVCDSIAGGCQIGLLQNIISLGDYYNVTLLCPAGYLYDKATCLQCNVVQVKYGLTGIVRLSHLIKAIKPDVVISHLLRTTLWIYLSTLLNRGRRFYFISTLHNPVIYPGLSVFRRASYPTILRMVGRRVDLFTCVSKEIGNSVRRLLPGALIRYRPNVIDCAAFGQKATKVTDGRVLGIAVIGRLTAVKGHKYLIEALERIRGRIEVRVLVAGEGELADRLTQTIEASGLRDRFTLTGFVEDIGPILDQVSIVAIPSVYEGTPQILFEAMAAGKVVIASNVGGIPDVICDGVNGMLVPPRDPMAIAAAIMKLSENRELLKTISVNARDTIRNEYALDKMIQLDREVYDNAGV